jgi:Tfp pilus assembly protein PilV
MEMVIAMGLFGVGLMGLSMMSSGLSTSNLSVRRQTMAIQLAENKLEMLAQGDYSEITDGLEEEIEASEATGNGVFKRTVVVEEITAPLRKEVTVTVSWRVKGRHRVVMKTAFAP